MSCLQRTQGGERPDIREDQIIIAAGAVDVVSGERIWEVLKRQRIPHAKWALGFSCDFAIDCPSLED
jgi:hypothetical protein